VEVVAPGKECDGAAATYRRQWRRSQIGAIGRRRLLSMEGRRQRRDPATPMALSNGRGAPTQRERERERGAAHRWQQRSTGSAWPRWSGRHRTWTQRHRGGGAAHSDQRQRSDFGQLCRRGGFMARHVAPGGDGAPTCGPRRGRWRTTGGTSRQNIFELKTLLKQN
jgi:hypothetical protein